MAAPSFQITQMSQNEKLRSLLEWEISHTGSSSQQPAYSVDGMKFLLFTDNDNTRLTETLHLHTEYAHITSLSSVTTVTLGIFRVEPRCSP